MTDLLNRLRAALKDRYHVEREVGRGGMATVYLATDVKHSRSVAIKVLSPDLAASVGHDRFLKEIEIAAKLQHPHILPVYDSGETDGLLYYVMPFVSGESLRDRLVRDGSVPAAEALRVAREIAGALDYAHRDGVVHRDIKPANILLSQGHAQVADFGIARAVSVSGGAGLTQAGMAIGTPAYMSPEQALGGTDIDGRTDVYALGCVLYEMLSGKPPFDGPTPQSIIAQSISADVPALAHDPGGAQPVIERAMAKEPAERFQTAGEFERALEAPVTLPVTAGTRAATRGLIGAAIVVALAILVFAVWPRGWSLEGDPRQSLIVFPFENKTGDADKDYLQEAAMNLLGLAAAHWEDMRVFDDERTASLMRRSGIEAPRDIDFDAAQAMAKEARVGTLVLGDIRREGDSLAIEAKVHDVGSGDRLATEILRARMDADPRALFDSLAGRILQVSGAPPGERPRLVAQTTHSLEAYRAYLRGVEGLQQFEIDTAQIYFARAVALDSSFALAYLRLRDVDGWAGLEGDPERRRQLVAKAEAHSASLPPRLRTLVQFHAAYENGEFVRARNLVKQLIARDSADVEAWYQLGEAHFHDDADRFPHPTDAGNLGSALRAFERTLELEPRYVLAYQHLVDVLGRCGGNSPWVCLEDSAAYAPQQELAERLGSERLQAYRDEARDARLAAARAWADATPGSPRPRFVLLDLLLDRDRLDEARTHLVALRASGDSTGSRIWESRLLRREARYDGAADSMTAALSDLRTAMRYLLSGDGPDIAFLSLAGGGRVTRLNQLLGELEAAVSAATATANGPGGLPLPIPSLMHFVELQLAAQLGVYPEASPGAAARWLDALDSLFASDSITHQRGWSNSGSVVLSAYFADRDTTLLSRFLSSLDTTGSRTWRAMDAHLALARGDTARARMRVERHVQNADSLEFSGSPGGARAFAWADLLAQLGQADEAADIYAHLDSSGVRSSNTGLHVRSWAERGALYQHLGRTELAIEMYERFIDAWRGADSQLQPLVDRARDAVAALRGEVREPARR